MNAQHTRQLTVTVKRINYTSTSIVEVIVSTPTLPVAKQAWRNFFHTSLKNIDLPLLKINASVNHYLHEDTLVAIR